MQTNFTKMMPSSPNTNQGNVVGGPLNNGGPGVVQGIHEMIEEEVELEQKEELDSSSQESYEGKSQNIELAVWYISYIFRY